MQFRLSLTFPLLFGPCSMPTWNPDSNNAESSRFNAYPFFAPRCWHAMSVSKLYGFFREGNFRFDRYPLAIGTTTLSPIHSVCNRIQNMLYWKRAAATPRETDPVFVIGHWRTGTTFLEYLLGLDDRTHTPDTYECMTPEHFLLTRRLFTRLISCPQRRPMDNIAMGWAKPQEDEFALCVRGATSVFRHFGFPNEPKRHLESLTMDDVPLRDLVYWKETLNRFVTYLNYKHQKPLILKSPTHTGRIHTLLEMFPHAKFIHLTRSPFDFIPSTMFLWESLDATSGMQREVAHIDHEDYVFDCFHRMYDSYESRKRLIPKGNLCEVTYDGLANDPLNTLQHIYDTLSLGEFSTVEPTVRSYLESKSGYQKNKHELSPRLEYRIASECRNYVAKYLPGQAPQRRAA